MIYFLKDSLNIPALLDAADYRAGGCIYAILFLLPLLWFWNRVGIRTILNHSSSHLIRSCFLGAALLPLPIGTLLIFLNYLGIIQEHQRIVMLGPLLLFVSLIGLATLLKNHKRLPKPEQILTLVEGMATALIFGAMAMGITLLNSEPFNFALLLGSWIYA